VREVPLVEGVRRVGGHELPFDGFRFPVSLERDLAFPEREMGGGDVLVRERHRAAGVRVPGILGGERLVDLSRLFHFGDLVSRPAQKRELMAQKEMSPSETSPA
jgi:hypothetical protein